jgi:hypothetical protein
VSVLIPTNSTVVAQGTSVPYNPTPNNVLNYVRTVSGIGNASADYSGTLLGNLSSLPGLSATFSISLSGLSVGAAFPTADLVGLYNPYDAGNLPNGVRLTFTAANGDIWYSQPAAFLYAPSVGVPAGASPNPMTNDVPTTLSVSFSDLNDWSDSNGHIASTEPTQFGLDLSNVVRSGVVFGAGYFATFGLAFDDPTATASFQLEGMGPLAAVPEPSTVIIWSLLGGLGLAVAHVRRKRA